MLFINLDQTNNFLKSKKLPAVDTKQYGLYTEDSQLPNGDVVFISYIEKTEFIKNTDQPIKFFREMDSVVTTLVLQEDPFEC